MVIWSRFIITALQSVQMSNLLAQGNIFLLFNLTSGNEDCYDFFLMALSKTELPIVTFNCISSLYKMSFPHCAGMSEASF